MITLDNGKSQCPSCKGLGVKIDSNEIQYGDPCDECAGTGIIYDFPVPSGEPNEHRENNVVDALTVNNLITNPIAPCPICNEPLTPLELELHQQFHYDCNKCSYCKKDVGLGQIESCIKKELPISHITCHDDAMEKEFRQRPVTITQEMLDWHNDRRLCFDEDMSMSVNANQTMASTNLKNARWLNEKPLENVYMFMKRLEAMAAQCSIMLTESKRKDSIRIEIATRDKKLVKDAVEGRVSEDRAKEIKRNRFTPKEKAINAMIAVGLSREEAIESLNEQEVKKLMKLKGISVDEARAELFPIDVKD